MRRSHLVLAALCLLFVAIGGVAAWRDSPTVDEVIDVAAGTSGVTEHDFRMLPEHGLLPRALVGSAALVAGPVLPLADGWQSGDWFLHTEEFVEANRAAGSLHATLFAARVASLAVGLLVGLALYVLGRRRSGELAGLIAAGAWLTTPVVIGFSHLAMIDVPFTLAVVLVALALDCHRTEPTDRRALVVGAAVAAALLSRHIGLVLVPVAAAVVVLAPAPARVRVRQAAIVGIGAWAFVWLAFLLADPTIPGGEVGARLDALVDIGRDGDLPVRLALLVPWPTLWGAGLGFLSLSTEARDAYLLGASWDGGRWWFFPASLVLRTTVPAVALLVLGAFVGEPGAWGRRLRSAAPIAGPALGMLAVLMVQPLNLGVRVALPVLALGLLAGAEVVARLAPRVRNWAVSAGAAVQAATLAVAVPATVAAVTLGPIGPDPYRVAADVDMGQDVEALYERTEGWDERPYAAVMTPLGMEDDSVRPLLGTDPDTVRGWVAVSAAFLNALHREELAWLRAYCPVDRIGQSIVLYRFEEPPEVTEGPVIPVAPCESEAASSRGG